MSWNWKRELILWNNFRGVFQFTDEDYVTKHAGGIICRPIVDSQVFVFALFLLFLLLLLLFFCFVFVCLFSVRSQVFMRVGRFKCMISGSG